MVYLEHLASALYLDRRETVDHYLAVMERLCVEALPTSASLEMLEGMLKRRLRDVSPGSGPARA